MVIFDKPYEPADKSYLVPKGFVAEESVEFPIVDGISRRATPEEVFLFFSEAEALRPSVKYL
jgi:hypothetical protein